MSERKQPSTLLEEHIGDPVEPGVGNLQVQVRDLPAMRIAARVHDAPAQELDQTVEALHRFVSSEGVGPAGPVMVVYPHWTDLWGDEGATLPVLAEVQLPVTRLVASDEVETRRIPSTRAACVIYQGVLGPAFRACHTTLFHWVEAQGLVRKGTTHHHAYLAQGPGPAWTIEIRVPLTG